ncbi:ARM repeat-containing protein [Phellopilus nigrolimitatus]|nr:ARM repeat-containing protein [Phellopilus nigrolimitatus]
MCHPFRNQIDCFTACELILNWLNCPESVERPTQGTYPKDAYQAQSSSASRQQFIPLLPDSHNRTRQHSAPSSTSLNASIWAPQPQSPGGTWPRDFMTLGKPGLPQQGFFPVVDDRPLTKEDVFGSSGGMHLSTQHDIGAIGDGRQKDLPFLRIREPVVPICLSILTVSPSTSSSFPTTPIESSPMTPRSSDALFNHLCGLGSTANFGPGYSPQNVLVPAIPKVSQDRYWNEVNFPALRGGFTHNQNLSHTMYQALPPVEPVSENHPPTAFANNVGSEHRRAATADWPQQHFTEYSDWPHLSPPLDGGPFGVGSDGDFECSRPISDKGRLGNDMGPYVSGYTRQHQQPASNEPINFLSLLHPSSTPPYAMFVTRIVRSSDQQASIFLQQKLKVADEKERAKIVDAICTRGTEMMSHRFGNWAVQRCLEAASSVEERRKIASCMRGNVVELATNCYGCHVLQKALDCEEDIRLLIVSELLLGDPAKTLINKHASHVWSKIMEISWTPPAPPIFTYVNKALQGRWASLACHETGSLVVQHAFENLEESAKDGIIDELLNRGSAIFAEVAKNQWGSYCIQHILEHGCPKHQNLALSHLLSGLLEFSTNEQGFKSVTKALKEGGKDALDKFVSRMRESPAGGRRAIIVDLALSTTGSQLIASVLPNIDKDQRAMLYDAIRGHITGSKVIWLLFRAYYGS